VSLKTPCPLQNDGRKTDKNSESEKTPVFVQKPRLKNKDTVQEFTYWRTGEDIEKITGISLSRKFLDPNLH
jgi:hypothetical protein